MLKQSALFKKLRRKNLTLYQYNILYIISQKEPSSFSKKQQSFIQSKLPSMYFNDDLSISNEGMKLIKDIDNLFKPTKTLKNVELLGEDYKDKIDEVIEMFPAGKLPNGKYGRGNKKNIEANFMWFFQEYEFDWNIILDATELYVNEFEKNSFKYLRTCQYFIKKVVDGTVQSELADYCQAILDGEGEIKETNFKTNVV